ncbi:MAG: DNA polymerase III subunit delta, partial [Hyphomicrobiales bacterium]
PGSDEWLRGATGDPAALLAALTHGDTLAISNELDKLALYTLDRGAQVTVDDIYEVCAGDREAGEFALRDAILDGRLKVALQTLELLKTKSDFTEALVLFQLLTAYRSLAVVVDLTMEKAPDAEIAKAMGRAGQYRNLVERAKTQALRIGPHGLRAAFEAIVEADRTSKTGEVDNDVALEILFGKLCAL